MKDTFDLLVKLDLKVLNKINSRKVKINSLHGQQFYDELEKLIPRELIIFVEQFDKDYKQFIAQDEDEYTLGQIEQSWKNIFLAQNKDNPFLCEESKKKLHVIYSLLNNSNVNKQVEIAGKAVEMELSLDLALKSPGIITIVREYRDHLSMKMKEHGIELSGVRENLNNYQKKLANRFDAINNVNEQIQGMKILDPCHFEIVGVAVKASIKNQPDWSERSFLQKLTDFLSLGLKPLYRRFFSKESSLINELQENDTRLIPP